MTLADCTYPGKREGIIECQELHVKQETRVFTDKMFIDNVENNQMLGSNPPNVYLFKVNNKNTRKRCEICSK